MSSGLQRWRTVSLIAVAAASIALLLLWPRVLFPLVAGFLLAYATHPLANAFERRRLPRVLGFVVVLLGLIALLAVMVFVFVPALVNELNTISEKLPSWQEVADERIGPLIADLQQRYPQAYEQFRQQFSTWLEGNLPGMAQRAARWAVQLLGSAFNLVAVLLNLILIPVIAAYLTVDFRKFVAALRNLVPRPLLEGVEAIVSEIHLVLVSFVRGQLLVAAALGFMYTVGMVIVDAPLALVIGPIAGVLSLVPYLGLISGAGTAVLLAFLDHQDLWHPLGVLIVFVVAQNIEGWVLTPRLLGGSVGLHPVWVLVALLVGADLFGLTGIIIAVPVAAALRVLLLHAIHAYTGTEFYLGKLPAVELVVRRDDADSRELETRLQRALRGIGLAYRRREALEEGEAAPRVEVRGEVVVSGLVTERTLKMRVGKAMKESGA